MDALFIIHLILHDIVTIFYKGLQLSNPLFIFNSNPKKHDSKNAPGKLPGN
jgi:hypothetical protein